MRLTPEWTHEERVRYESAKEHLVTLRWSNVKERIRVVLLVMLALSVLGCDQHVTRRTRTARAVAVTGVIVATVGGVATAGCFDVSRSGTGCISTNPMDEGCASPDGCRGGPKGADLALGLPLLAVGAGMVIGALLTRPKSQRRNSSAEPLGMMGPSSPMIVNRQERASINSPKFSSSAE